MLESHDQVVEYLNCLQIYPYGEKREHDLAFLEIKTSDLLDGKNFTDEYLTLRTRGYDTPGGVPRFFIVAPIGKSCF